MVVSKTLESQNIQDLNLPMTNHEMIAFALKNYKGKILATDEITRIVLGTFPCFNEGSLGPNDHSIGNKSPCVCACTNSRIFDRIKRGSYLVL